MRAEDLLPLRPALDDFLMGFDDCAVAPTRKHIGTYVRGQLGTSSGELNAEVAL